MTYWLLGTLAFWVQGGMFAAPSLAHALMDQNRYRAALPILLWQYSIRRWMPDQRGHAELQLCECYLHLGNFPAARLFADRALPHLHGPGHESYLQMQEAYLIVLHMHSREYEEAAARIDKALAADRASEDLKRWIVTCAHGDYAYLQVDRLDEAISLLNGVLAATPECEAYRAWLKVRLAWCHFYQDNPDQAIAIVRDLPDSPASWNANLVFLAETGDLESARPFAEKLQQELSRRQTNDRETHGAALGVFALRSGNLDQARDYALRMMEEDSPLSRSASLLLQAEIFAARENLPRLKALCDEIEQSETIAFFKRRARALRERFTTETRGT